MSLDEWVAAPEYDLGALRILIVDTFYPDFIRTHYRSRPELAQVPYGEQWRRLMDTGFGTADSYSYFLRQLGHEAHEVIANCDLLQLAWAREHDLPLTLRARLRLGRGWRFPLLVAQVDEFEPDVLYLQNVALLPPHELRVLRSRTHLLAGQVATEAPGVETLRSFDLIVTSFPHFVERFRAAGIAAEYLRIGFDCRIPDRLRDERNERRWGAVFVGTLHGPQWLGSGRLLEAAAQRVTIDFWGCGADRLPADSAILARYHSEAWGLDMYRIYAEARIVVNRHGDVAEDFANNMRLYEATGMGALLLTDAKRNLHDLFEPGVEVATYADEDGLVQTVRYYLEHESERARIAAAGQKRTMQEHTYSARIKELVEILERHVA